MSDLDHCKRRPLRYGLELEARLCVMCATGILHTGRLGDMQSETWPTLHVAAAIFPRVLIL